MRSLSKILLIFLLAFNFLSCSKESENETPVMDRFGFYQGLSVVTVTRPASTTTESHNIFIEISRGDSDQELKLRFGTQFTRAVLNENKFTIQETLFNIPPRVASGNGEFLPDNKLKLNYYVKNDSVTIYYSGTLSK
jgi:hypothetical protein